MPDPLVLDKLQFVVGQCLDQPGDLAAGLFGDPFAMQHAVDFAIIEPNLPGKRPNHPLWEVGAVVSQRIPHRIGG
jgi:hypothetical protein